MFKRNQNAYLLKEISGFLASLVICLKTSWFYVLICVTSFTSNSIYAKDCSSPLGIVLMVKNEEAVICQTLEPFIEAGVDSYFIYDTGSEDNTVSVVKDYLEQHAIPHAYIVQEEWVDYATSRNRALDLAQEQLAHCSFLLMIDAEWYTQNVPELLEFCKQEAPYNQLFGYYNISITGGNEEFKVSRLIPQKSKSRFKGKVHETLEWAPSKDVPPSIVILYKPASDGIEKTRKRFLRDKKILEGELNTRTLFYLAQTCECLNDLESAYKYYTVRTTIQGWGEEDYMAWYRLARVTEALYHGKAQGWSEALGYYLKAYSLRPHRIEPLMKIAEHYRLEDNMPLCHLFAVKALEAPYPDQDLLFVEKDMYEFDRYDLVAISAWWVGDFERGYHCLLQAMQARPDMPHLAGNLQCYFERMNVPKLVPSNVVDTSTVIRESTDIEQS